MRPEKRTTSTNWVEQLRRVGNWCIPSDPADDWQALVWLYRRYRATWYSRTLRKLLRAATPLTVLAFAGLALTMGGILMSIGAAHAQLFAAQHPLNQAGLFSYWEFDVGLGLFFFGATWGVLAVASSSSRSAMRKTTPLILETDYGVYAHEYKSANEPRLLRVRVYNSEPDALDNVRVRLLGGSPIKAADYLRVMGDDVSPYAESRRGVSLGGYGQRYFLVAIIDPPNAPVDVLLGFANDQLAEANRIPVPTMHGQHSDTFVMLMAEGRRVVDGSEVQYAYGNFELVNYGPVGMKQMANAQPLYGKPTTLHQRQFLP